MQQIEFSKYDLLTGEGRESAFSEIAAHAKAQFALIGVSEQSWVSVREFHIEIAIMDTKQEGAATCFASSVGLSVRTRINEETAKWEASGPLSISISGTRMFDPAEEPHLALKHLNMAALLSDWGKTVQLFDFHTAEHRRLIKLIEEATGVKL